MQEFDLQALWNEADAGAEKWYQQLRPELEQMARQQNASVLARLRRLMWSEIVGGSVLFLWLFYELYREQVSLMVYLFVGGIFFVACWISYRYYAQFSRRVEAIPTMNVIASTQAYLHEVQQYRQRMIRMSLIASPISVLIGYVTGVVISSDISIFYEPTFWLTTLAAMIGFGLLIYFGLRAYYNYFIGGKEAELVALLQRLQYPQEEE